MSQKFHNYKFITKDSPLEFINKYHKIKICSKKLDDEIYLYSTNGGGDYSLYLQDRFFNLNIDNKTKNISSFEGDLNINFLKFTNLQLPKNTVNVILSLDTNDELQQGCGGYIQFDDSKVYYDKSQKLLQIGDINPKETTYKFIENGFAQIKKNSLTGLIFTEIEL